MRLQTPKARLQREKRHKKVHLMVRLLMDRAAKNQMVKLQMVHLAEHLEKAAALVVEAAVLI